MVACEFFPDKRNITYINHEQMQSTVVSIYVCACVCLPVFYVEHISFYLLNFRRIPISCVIH